VNDALAAARAIVDLKIRAEALQVLANRLPLNEQSAVYVEALTTVRAITDRWDHAEALRLLIADLPTYLLSLAWMMCAHYPTSGFALVCCRCWLPVCRPVSNQRSMLRR